MQNDTYPTMFGWQCIRFYLSWSCEAYYKCTAKYETQEEEHVEDAPAGEEYAPGKSSKEKSECTIDSHSSVTAAVLTYPLQCDSISQWTGWAKGYSENDNYKQQ